MAKRKIKRTVSKKKEPNWKVLFFIALIAFVGVGIHALYKTLTVAKMGDMYAFGQYHNNVYTTCAREAKPNTQKYWDCVNQRINQVKILNVIRKVGESKEKDAGKDAGPGYRR